MTEQVIVTELPLRWDQKAQRRSDWTMSIQLLEDDEVTPKVTTGYTMSVYIRSAPNGELYQALSVGSGISHTPGSGLFNIRLTAAQIGAFTFSRAVYDVQITEPSGGKVVPFIGDFLVEGLAP